MTLREQCEAKAMEIVKALRPLDPGSWAVNVEGLRLMLEYFAKSQQAVGLREAADYAREKAPLPGPSQYEAYNILAEWCEQQAREREGTP